MVLTADSMVLIPFNIINNISVDVRVLNVDI